MEFLRKTTMFAKDQIQKEQARMEREKALSNLSKDQLFDLASEYGIAISKEEAKEDVVYKMSKNDQLTVKEIMQKSRKSKPKTIIAKSVKKKVKEENIEIEQQVERIEKIKTTIRRKTREIQFEDEVTKIVRNFEPIIKKDIKEKDVEGQLVQSLRAIIPKEKVDYQQRGRSGRADIVIGRDIAIELKLINGSSQLMALKGQLHSYSKEYEKLYVWMYDLNNVLKHQTLDTFRKELTEMGVENVEVIKRP